MSTAEAPELVIQSYAVTTRDSEGHARLKAWALAHCSQSDRVREEFVLSSISAILHRAVHFGIEDGFSIYSSRELLQFQVMTGISLGTTLARVTATRAIIENDRAVIAALADSGLCTEVLAWFDELDSATAEHCQTLLPTCEPTEELHTGRLVVARQHPELAEATWLWDIPDKLGRLGAAMASVLIHQRNDLLASVTMWLTRHPEALYSVDPDELLAPLVARSSERPQTILLPLEGAYGDATVVSAAEWHLEHQEPREALDLCARIRPLSQEADRARAIAAMARLELGEPAVARRIAADILDSGWAASVGVRLAQIDPEQTSDQALTDLALIIPADRAETFFLAVSLLVRRRAVAQARAVTRARGGDFRHHPPVAEIMRILGTA